MIRVSSGLASPEASLAGSYGPLCVPSVPSPDAPSVLHLYPNFFFQGHQSGWMRAHLNDLIQT